MLDVLTQKLRSDLSGEVGAAPTPVNAIVSGPGMGSVAIVKEIASLFAQKEGLPLFKDNNRAQNAVVYMPGEKHGVSIASVSSDSLVELPYLPGTKPSAAIFENTKNNILHLHIEDGVSDDAMTAVNKLLVDKKLSWIAPSGEQEDWVPKTIFLTGNVDANKIPQVVKNSMNFFFMEEPSLARLSQALAHRREVFAVKPPQPAGPKEFK